MLQVTSNDAESHVFKDEAKVKAAVAYMNVHHTLPQGRPWKMRREPNKLFTIMGLTVDNQLMFLKMDMNSKLPFMK